MKARVDNLDGTNYGIVELEPEDGYHAGTTIETWVAEDGWVTVQVNTPGETETHDMTRIYLNEAHAVRFSAR